MEKSRGFDGGANSIWLIDPAASREWTMKRSLLPCLLVLTAFAPAFAQDSDPIPPDLDVWRSWVLRDRHDLNSPRVYSDGKERIASWPSALNLLANETEGFFQMAVDVYDASWVRLPGDSGMWPVSVMQNGAPAPVLARDGLPTLYLPPGHHEITGQFRWPSIPQRIRVPTEIALLTLEVANRVVELPTWGDDGWLWLSRKASPEGQTAKNHLATQVYTLLQDGIPMWLRIRVELVVAGKSREETVGCILPEGWQLASVQSPLPVAVDDSGVLKAQVRAGRWPVDVVGFRIDNPKTIRYPADLSAAVPTQIIGLQGQPDFRMIEFTGVAPVDVSQTTFPEEWRRFPVYRWETSGEVGIKERLRGQGAGASRSPGVQRSLWLDPNGKVLTFVDRLTGQEQTTWRLDVAPGQQLGSVRNEGEGQLVTKNPATGAPGVEIRTRTIDLEATGQMARESEISAIGWETDAGSLTGSLTLPPGWRLFAMTGPEWVRGDWLTSWNLLDLFVVLVFSFAVYRIFGLPTAILGFFALGLSYHESGAPRFLWLALLVPLALLLAPLPGRVHKTIRAIKWLAAIALILVLVPFISNQIQQALYPQLEKVKNPGQPVSMAVSSSSARQDQAVVSEAQAAAPDRANDEYSSRLRSFSGGWGKGAGSGMGTRNESQKANLLWDAKAQIQTGPGIPEWTWRTISFGWNGPVTRGETIRPILISATFERLLSVFRVVLLVALIYALLSGRGRIPAPPPLPSASLLCLVILIAASSMGRANAAPFPPPELLEQLREQALRPPPAFPDAAEIPDATLSINGSRMDIAVTIDAGAETAVPLPGKFPVWSPLSVELDGQAAPALRRKDGFLWIVVPAGTHQVRMEGLLGNADEWEWSFLLKPHHVTVDAPGWEINGIRANGVPDGPILFSRKERGEKADAAYDRQDYRTIALVTRTIELGLQWEVRTTVERLSSADTPMTLHIPLLPGENLLAANMVVRDGRVEVRLGSRQKSAKWQSELSTSDSLALETRKSDPWVEQWIVITSPVWNMSIDGLQPTYEESASDLVPIWKPWPGESTRLAISRPEAIEGSTLTVNRADRTVNLGSRQRTESLTLSLLSSLGGETSITLPPDAQVTDLSVDIKNIPARVEDHSVIIPLQPGKQTVKLDWTQPTGLGIATRMSEVKLAVDAANVSTDVSVPRGRWVLWTDGPQRGPAVRFWPVVTLAVIGAVVLSRFRRSPLGWPEWVLLGLGLTQIPLLPALFVVGWLFFLSWRGTDHFTSLSSILFNLCQILLISTTAGALIVLLWVVGAGLLGTPQMFIAGNGSTAYSLRWFEPSSTQTLPSPTVVSISIWWYRLAMLLWALWLASATVRWLGRGWSQFGKGGYFRSLKRTK